MAFNLESLDDPLIFDAAPSFSGGQVSNVRANLLTQAQLAEAVNCDITRQGQLVTRRGTRRLGDAVGTVPGSSGPVGMVQGLWFYDTPTQQYLVAAAGGRIYSYQAGAWTQLIDGGTYFAADGQRPINFAQGIDSLFIVDGSGPLYIFDGTAAHPVTGNHRPPNGGRFLAWHTFRLIVGGFAGEPDALYFSDYLKGNYFNSALGQLRVGQGEGDPITAIVPWTNFDLVVFKRHSIWVVGCNPGLNTNGDDASSVQDFTIQALTRRIGCVAPRSAAQVGDDVFFLSDTGVRSVRRSVATEQRAETADSLSEPVRDVLERITPSAIGSCAATFWNNKYLLSLPLDGSLVPNYVLVYNIITSSWSGLWTGWTPTDWAVSATGGNLRLCIGQADGTVLEWLDWVAVENETSDTFRDAGREIATSLLTRSFAFNDPVSPKTGFYTEFEFNGSRSDVTLQVTLDDSGPVVLDAFSTASAHLDLPLSLPFVLPKAGIVRRAMDLQRYGQFRELQFLLGSVSGKLALRSIMASAFVDTIEVQR